MLLLKPIGVSEEGISLPFPNFWWFSINLWYFLAYRGITVILCLYMVFSL